MNEPLYRALLEHARVAGDATGCSLTGPVVLNRYGRPQRLAPVIMNHMPRIMHQAGLLKPDGTHKYTFHQLRHFAGSAWLAQGMPIDEVSRLLGHGRIEITKKVYLHQLEGDMRARTAVERVGALIFGQPMPILPAPPPLPALEYAAPAPEINGSAVVASGSVELTAVTADSAALVPLTLAEFRKQQRERVVARWKAGQSYQEIMAAEQGGVSSPTISEWVQEAKGNLRRAVLRKARYVKLTPEERAIRNQRSRDYYRNLPEEKRQEKLQRGAALRREMTPEERELVNAKQRAWYAKRKTKAAAAAD